ncbi:glycoside hydrolase family 3 C-terminal domain-containing protein [bacterium]|nr:glycoside hydrolase family 3 C-terminal domain-containing protein [bacterium]
MRVLAMTLLLALAADPARAAGEPYRDPDRPVDERVADLLGRMTAEEKFWQLFMVAGTPADDGARYTQGAFGFQLDAGGDRTAVVARADAVQRRFVEDTRLGIPVIVFAEALHGLVHRDATVFPQAIGLAATFDTGLMAEVAAAIAVETRDHGVRQVLSPVVNLADDVRWGRVEETYGADPFLAAAMGVAFVRAFEQRGIVTTPKHLVANVGRGGRDSYPIDAGERRLRERDLPPFAACLAEGGARSIMTAYNSLGGVPCTASAWLNRTWLKDELGFDGFVISDAGAVGGAVVLHGTATDYADAGARALAGGLDVIFQTAFEHAALFLPAFTDGRIDPTVLDAAVARVLRAKFALGLFEHPYGGDTPPVADRAAHRALARRAARASVVLLENRDGLLPLDGAVGSIAVIGPDAAEARLGGYSGPGPERVAILAGIRERFGAAVEVRHAKGCDRAPAGVAPVPAAALSARLDGVTGAGLVGAYFANVDLDGAPALTRLDPQVDFQWSIASPAPDVLPGDFYSVRWTGELTAPGNGAFALGVSGDDGYRLWLDDELVLDNWRPLAAGTRMAPKPLAAGRAYAIRLEFRSPTGNARIRLVWDREAADEEADLAAAVDLAATSDVAVVVAGLAEGEFRDRSRLALPGRQDELIRRVAATGTPTVVVLVAGSAVDPGAWVDRVGAVLQVWYPGEEGGPAVAEILAGDASPAGRLPFDVPFAEGQLPLTYDHTPTGRGDDYADLTGRARYPFGYGLGYTRFAYADLVVTPPVIAPGDTAVISCTVTNTGPRAGDEVVQLYLRDEIASVARPVLALKGFRRVALGAGESRAVRFVLGPDELSLLDRDLVRVVEPGDFRVMVGASSRDVRLRGVLGVVR